MTTTINASPTNGLVQTADGSGVLKVQSNGVTTNALAWVNFAGASGTRNASYNVSSVTRNGTGDYTVNFASALTDANYAISTSSYRTNDANPSNPATSAPTTTSFQMVTMSSTFTKVDATAAYAIIFGN